MDMDQTLSIKHYLFMDLKGLGSEKDEQKGHFEVAHELLQREKEPYWPLW